MNLNNSQEKSIQNEYSPKDDFNHLTNNETISSNEFPGNGIRQTKEEDLLHEITSEKFLSKESKSFHIIIEDSSPNIQDLEQLSVEDELNKKKRKDFIGRTSEELYLKDNVPKHNLKAQKMNWY